MPVKVVTIKPSQNVQGGSTEEVAEVTHSGATAVQLKDGHLLVVGSNGMVSAIHAPGRFAYGEVLGER